MTLGRRIRLFLIGIALGCVAAWFFFGERLTNSAWLPEDRIKLRLKTTLVKATPEGTADLAAWPTTLDSVRSSIARGEVILKETRRHGDSLTYTVDVVLAGRSARVQTVVLEDLRVDTLATLVALGPR